MSEWLRHDDGSALLEDEPGQALVSVTHVGQLAQHVARAAGVAQRIRLGVIHVGGGERPRTHRGSRADDTIHQDRGVERHRDRLTERGQGAQMRRAADGIAVRASILDGERGPSGQRGDERLVLERGQLAEASAHGEDTDQRVPGHHRDGQDRAQPGLAMPLDHPDARVRTSVGDVHELAPLGGDTTDPIAERERRRHRHGGQVASDGGSPQLQDASARLGRPQMHDGRAQEPRGRIGNALEDHIHVERTRHHTFQLGELAQAVGTARGFGVEVRVVDGERCLLAHEAQRVDLGLGERALAPVVDGERAVDTLLGEQRRGGHGLEALALDLGSTIGNQPHVRVGEDVRRRHRATLEHGPADGSAGGRDGAAVGVLGAQPSYGAEHSEFASLPVPGRHQRRLRCHHLHRGVRDRVEHLVEIERGGERPADRLHRAREDGTTLSFRRIHEKCRHAGDVTVTIGERNAARLDTDGRPAVVARRLRAEACLAADGLPQVPGQPDRVEERKETIGVTPDRRGARQSGQTLHGRVPLHDRE